MACCQKMGDIKLPSNNSPNLRTTNDTFYKGFCPKRAIVSIDKLCIRPIEREKETKLVEIGAKIYKLQIDVINFVEYLRFEAFNEGTRLQSTI